MSLREIVLWPDPRLGTVCAEVAAVGPEIETLAADMLETMYAAPGRGLAAPQVGEMVRVFVMDAAWKEGTPAPMVFINPVLEARSVDLVTTSEGCLSIPGVVTDVARPAEVTLSWTNVQGARQTQAFSGFAAACVQHELDHLDGMVTLDHLSAEAREEAERRYAEAHG